MGQIHSIPNRSEPVVLMDSNDTWGYHFLRDYPGWNEINQFKKFVYIHNSLNASGIFLSPIAGVIRIATAIFLYNNLSKGSQEKFDFDLEAMKRFYKMEIKRGVLELFCLGIILGTIVDITATCKRKPKFPIE